MRRWLKGCLVIVLLLGLNMPQFAAAHSEGEAETVNQAVCDAANWYCPTESANELDEALAHLTTPTLTAPESPIATPTITVRKPMAQTVTYDVTTRGNITADFAAFKTLANETLNHSMGWSRLGVTFKQVDSGGQFTLVLAEASEVPSFSSGCSADYSCNVGRYVIINQDRWQGATEPWNAAGGGLRDYRHMVVNHETGHWLGHGHQNCPGAGQAAALMQQQSINLQGCKFNPWPLDSEIWSSRLGI